MVQSGEISGGRYGLCGEGGGRVRSVGRGYRLTGRVRLSDPSESRREQLESGYCAPCADRGHGLSEFSFFISQPSMGSAGVAPQQFGLFRRSSTVADRGLPASGGLAHQLSTQLARYDPALIRSVVAPPLPREFGRHSTVTNYIVVGMGAAAELVLSKFPCSRSLSLRARRNLKRFLKLERPFTPLGSSFCFISLPQPISGHVSVHPWLSGLCDSFAHLASGYGGSEISFSPEGPGVASVVPDGVSSVLLHYRRHRPVRAPVTENVYWTRVPALPSLTSNPPVKPLATVRRAILRGVPASIQWLAADGSIVRTFRPSKAYIDRQVRTYEACVALTCGA